MVPFYFFPSIRLLKITILSSLKFFFSKLRKHFPHPLFLSCISSFYNIYNIYGSLLSLLCFVHTSVLLRTKKMGTLLQIFSQNCYIGGPALYSLAVTVQYALTFLSTSTPFWLAFILLSTGSHSSFFAVSIHSVPSSAISWDYFLLLHFIYLSRYPVTALSSSHHFSMSSKIY